MIYYRVAKFSILVPATGTINMGKVKQYWIHKTPYETREEAEEGVEYYKRVSRAEEIYIEEVEDENIGD